MPAPQAQQPQQPQQPPQAQGIQFQGPSQRVGESLNARVERPFEVAPDRSLASLLRAEPSAGRAPEAPLDPEVSYSELGEEEAPSPLAFEREPSWRKKVEMALSNPNISETDRAQLLYWKDKKRSSFSIRQKDFITARIPKF